MPANRLRVNQHDFMALYYTIIHQGLVVRKVDSVIIAIFANFLKLFIYW